MRRKISFLTLGALILGAQMLVGCSGSGQTEKNIAESAAETSVPSTETASSETEPLPTETISPCPESAEEAELADPSGEVVEDVLMTASQIESWNYVQYRTEGTHMTDLSAVPETDGYRYAIAMHNTALRIKPTADQELNEIGFDLNLESMLMIGEPVLIASETGDGWYQVIAENDTGYASAADLILCDREFFMDWLDDRNSGTGCLVAISQDVATDTGETLRMGTVLPGHIDGDTAVLELPAGDDNGKLIRTEQMYANADAFSEGYLPLTEERLLAQAEKMLGTAYGWGDQNGNPDCSSTMVAIYRTFGFRLPRNTSWQEAMSAHTIDYSGMTAAEKLDSIQALPVGSLIFFSGHVMMYVGEENGQPMIIHNASRFSRDGSTAETVMRCVKTDLNLYQMNGTPYVEALTKAVTMF